MIIQSGQSPDKKMCKIKMDQYSASRTKILFLTVLVIFAGLIIPKEWIQSHIAVFAIALILGGVPHGASDYLVFKQLIARKATSSDKWFFGISYLSVIALYGFVWWLNALLAFAIFIIVSVYHFGQSNWEYVEFPSKTWEVFTYSIWGCLVIAVPVLIYHEEAALIISEITGYLISLEAIRWPGIFLVVAANCLNIVYMLEAELIDMRGLREELFNLLVLFGLFISTPLLIGFGVYFVFWHSLKAVLDQIKIFKQHNQHYDFGPYLMQLVPLSLLAFAGLGILYWLAGNQMNYGLNLGVLFIFISIITVPHSILMDRFYLTQNIEIEANKIKT